MILGLQFPSMRNGKLYCLWKGTHFGGYRSGGVRQHRKRLCGELNINLKPRPLDSALVALFKKKN